MVHLKIKALSEEVADLYRSHGNYHEGDSGLDLYVVEEQCIPSGETRFIKLGIKASAWTNDRNMNVSWLLMPRSSIAKTPLRLCNSVGLIDAGYRGEVMAAVDNIKKEDFTVKKGDRLVQAVSFGGEGLTFELVDSLDDTTRGEGGFGSTSTSTPHSEGGQEGAKSKTGATAETSEAKKAKVDEAAVMPQSVEAVGSSSS